MWSVKDRIIDSHVHLDLIYKENPNRIEWLKEYGYILISWAFATGIKSLSGLKEYMQDKTDIIRHLRREGLDCFLLCGIHPRNIAPDIHPEDVEDILLPLLDDPICLGIGEVGLETGSNQEREILEAHLKLGPMLVDMGKRIGIHTPRKNKLEITFKILELLDNHSGLEEIIVIDHCTPETIGYVLEKGYWAGVTLSPIKTSLYDLKRIVNEYPLYLHRIMCNTDSGMVFYEDMYHLYRSKEFLPEVKNKLTFENAYQFFTFEPSLLCSCNT